MSGFDDESRIELIMELYNLIVSADRGDGCINLDDPKGYVGI